MFKWFSALPNTLSKVSILANVGLVIGVLTLGIFYVSKSGDYNTLNADHTALQDKYNVLSTDYNQLLKVNHGNNDVTHGLNDFYQDACNRVGATDDAIFNLDKITSNSLRSLEMASLDTPPVTNSILTSKQPVIADDKIESSEESASEDPRDYSREVFDGKTAKSLLKVQVPQELISIVNNTGT
ncbi:hypothetical protein [Yersinia ruckeri]|uniref:hypothetical protein n=1 Tax=Yersinia ruckeri TaxID=29486 RepID=UPI0022390121|nr:hypothetical protein [Yersinia ruckeri]MCW6598629.1 hypothetical protein [Yersinia ruckeri]